MRRGNVIIEAWEQRILDERDAVTVTTRCAWCGWTRTGTLRVVRAAHSEHRATKHPDIPVPARRKRLRPFRQFQSEKNLDDNIANARAQGASGWAGPE